MGSAWWPSRLRRNSPIPTARAWLVWGLSGALSASCAHPDSHLAGGAGGGAGTPAGGSDATIGGALAGGVLGAGGYWGTAGVGGLANRGGEGGAAMGGSGGAANGGGGPTGVGGSGGLAANGGSGGTSAGGASPNTGGLVGTGGASPGGAATGGTPTGGCPPAPPGSPWAMWKMPNPPNWGLPNPASYTDLGDGTVRDNVTGLFWQRDVPSGTYTWAEAKDYCGSLLLPGCGWRLPTRIELVSLVDFNRSNPAIDTAAFPNTPSEGFWSSSLRAGSSSYAWIVYFDYGGDTDYYDLAYAFRVRCVR